VGSDLIGLRPAFQVADSLVRKLTAKWSLTFDQDGIDVVEVGVTGVLEYSGTKLWFEISVGDK
jgi:hypothetical protein